MKTTLLLVSLFCLSLNTFGEEININHLLQAPKPLANSKQGIKVNFNSTCTNSSGQVLDSKDAGYQRCIREKANEKDNTNKHSAGFSVGG